MSRTVGAQKAGEAAAAADLANARLSAQATLAQTYFQLRAADATQKLLDDTVASYQKSLQLTQNQYAQGVAARSDVIQAQTCRATRRRGSTRARSRSDGRAAAGVARRRIAGRGCRRAGRTIER